ncbi:SCP2 sterol-binding domain-containing protein [Allorhizocola rhizosphaerae]|uniref:SCP2 sterol-binding domain-containing protein n=1 Tax=Allorhizocola rhizosphaerae TaxID=1872709 RepID=UPI0013C2D3B3|nr:SCP2 sterol-binding domain-containing protein [Allorhizocola rhizosphaerae]
MADATSRFFADIAQRGHEPLLRNVEGSIRIDVRNGKRVEGRTLIIDHGALTVSDAPEADCQVAMDRELFNRLVTGQTSAIAAVLRGAVIAKGSLELLIQFQRLLPGRMP